MQFSSSSCSEGKRKKLKDESERNRPKGKKETLVFIYFS